MRYTSKMGSLRQSEAMQRLVQARYRQWAPEMLAMMRQFIKENGYAPDIREIGEALGHSSTSVTNQRLQRLALNGEITRKSYVSRGITLKGQKVLFFSSETPSAEEVQAELERVGITNVSVT